MANPTLGKYWSKRVTEFRDRLYFLVRRRGLTMDEAHLAYLASMPREYWTVHYPFQRSNMRFFIEVVLGWFTILHALESCNSRQEFLDKYGLPDHTKDLIPKTEADYPKLLRYLGREEQKPTINTTKP